MKTIDGSYQYRVNFAAAYMVRGISNSRALDNCFEMFDGDLVVTTLVRRAMKNRKLWEAIARQWREGFPQSWLNTAMKYAHIPTRQLAAAAHEMREKAQQRWNAQREAA